VDREVQRRIADCGLRITRRLKSAIRNLQSAICYPASVRLALDVTYALDPLPSGVARYSDRLVRELATLAGVSLTLCARWPRCLRLARHFEKLSFDRSCLQEPFNVLLPRRVDLFHGLNQRLPHYRFRRQVVTVHDVFPLSSAAYSTPEFQARFAAIIRDAVRRADRIICVSSYTRARLCETAGVSPELCDVVPHGVDRPWPAPLRARRRARDLAGGEPFFLSVGAVQVRKNSLGVVQALAQIPLRGVRLLLAGSAGHGAEAVFDFVRQHNLRDRVRLLGFVDEELLAGLYSEATGLLFPSLEEGFGLPVLEAMARGLPVIASNSSALPEVAGDAAILVDPRDTGAMAQSALRLLQDAVWRQEWIERGLARAAGFTWARTAALTLETYRRVL